VLKFEYDGEGSYLKHKARLVVRGFASFIGTDFFSTYSPMSELTTTRTVPAIAAKHKTAVHHSDVPNAFIQAYVDSDIHICSPGGISLIDP